MLKTARLRRRSGRPPPRGVPFRLTGCHQKEPPRVSRESADGPDFSVQGGLLPAIAQDATSGEVLMLAYMNRESYAETLRTGEAVYYSRSRGKLWRKGEESGHIQRVRAVYLDCDADTILLRVEQVGGAACHEGYRSCFFRRVTPGRGGMDIELVAARTPERIFREPFQPGAGLWSYQARKLAWRLGLAEPSVRAAEKFLRGLARVFVEKDCSLLEINPLVLTAEGSLLALDAKITFDDNALMRHDDLAALRDLAEEQPAEVRASEEGLSYVKLDGNIGCLVNGAGLAMSTMDLIKLHGGRPANFLDVGGGANVHQVTEAFRILLGDKNVRAVLVNIFGGIMRCTTIAEAILRAYQSVGFNVPLVVRLEGTEVEQGRKILAQSNLDIIAADGLTDAAEKVVAAASGRSG